MSELDNSTGDQTPSGISRRTVTKAIAWSVPVIAVAAAVPAYAASRINFSLNGAGCKLPGNSNSTYKGYAFKLAITNSSSVPITIQITSITLNGTSLGQTALVDLNQTPASFDANPFVLNPGQSVPNGALLTANAANSSAGTLSITYTINGGAPITVSGPTNSAAPINGASCDAFTPAEKVKLSLVNGVPPVWAANTAYAVGDTIRLSTGEVLVASIAGTSGATQPSPPPSGGTVVDGTVTWTRP